MHASVLKSFNGSVDGASRARDMHLQGNLAPSGDACADARPGAVRTVLP